MGHYERLKIIVTFLCIFVLMAVMPINGFGEVPQQFNFQGYLTDNLGSPLNDDYEMVFSVYNDQSSVTALWQEEQLVTVTNGNYGVNIGQDPIGNPFPSNLFEGERWLGVAVGNDPEMVPRQKIVSVPFAFKAEKADEADTLDGMDSSTLDQSAHLGRTDNPHSVTAAQTGAATLSDITWGNLSNIPSDFDDGEDNIGIEFETDPTVLSSVKDGVSWGELSGIPSGFADGVDNVGITSETDPQVGSNTTNYVPRWNGSALVTGSIYDDGNVGIGLTAPNKKLYISKGAKSLEYALKIDNPAAGVGLSDGVGVLFSSGGDGSGNVSRDRGKGALVYELTETWNRGKFHFLQDSNANTANPTMTDSVMTIQNDGRVGIGTRSPGETFHVVGDVLIGSPTKGLRIRSSGDLVDLESTGANLVINNNSGLNTIFHVSQGSVGIGTWAPNPGYKLHVEGGSIGRSTAIDGIGIEGLAEGSSGLGVYGKATGSSGLGVYGEASNSGDTENYGGYFKAFGHNGTGVYGEAYSSENDLNYGGYFTTHGGEGRAVYGFADNGWDVFNYGGYFVARGTYGIGVRGSGQNMDFYAAGSGTNYAPFTGAHEVRFAADLPDKILPGMIVSVTGRVETRKKDNGEISISSTLPTVTLTTIPMDKTVFGVVVSEGPLPEDHWYEFHEAERFGKVNALGEGRVWITNMNGDIEVGDYITSSIIPGYGQLQDDDLVHSYTVGKAIETLDWKSVTDTVEMNGNVYKVYLIAVTYTSG